MGHIDHSRMPNHRYTFRSRETNDFVCAYRECLLELSKLEQQILTLWYDTNFEVSHTPQEIADEIKSQKLTPGQVTGIKILAMKKIMNNPKMKKYRGHLG